MHRGLCELRVAQNAKEFAIIIQVALNRRERSRVDTLEIEMPVDMFERSTVILIERCPGVEFTHVENRTGATINVFRREFTRFFHNICGKAGEPMSIVHFHEFLYLASVHLRVTIE